MDEADRMLDMVFVKDLNYASMKIIKKRQSLMKH